MERVKARMSRVTTARIPKLSVKSRSPFGSARNSGVPPNAARSWALIVRVFGGPFDGIRRGEDRARANDVAREVRSAWVSCVLEDGIARSTEHLIPLGKTISPMTRVRQPVLQVAARRARRLGGSLSMVRKTCIRPSCRACACDDKHPAFLLAFTEKGRRRCMEVPKELVGH